MWELLGWEGRDVHVIVCCSDVAPQSVNLCAPLNVCSTLPSPQELIQGHLDFRHLSL